MTKLALIPARAGSKRLPGKNSLKLGSKPLISYTIETVLESSYFDETVVSTDDPTIRDIAIKYPGVTVVQRPEELASDSATVAQVLYQLLTDRKSDGKVDNICGVFLPTLPFRMAKDIQEGLKLLDKNIDSVISVSSFTVPPQFAMRIAEGNLLKPVSSDSPLLTGLTRRQQQEIFYHQNGAFFLGWVPSFLKYQSFFHGKVKSYIMPRERSVDIDESFDLLTAKAILANRKPVANNSDGVQISNSIQKVDKLKRKAEGIKLFAMDVDGVLTDSGMYYSENGDELKKFNTRDGRAIELLRRKNIKTAILTSENTMLLERRGKKLEVDYVIQGCKNKVKEIGIIMKEMRISFEDVAYIGDDLNDIELLKKVGISATPHDGIDEVKELVDIVLDYKGGEGCVREFVSKFIQL